MKKFIKVFTTMLVLLSLVGCSSSKANKSIEEGKLSFDDGDYEQALSSFEFALDKGSKEEEVEVMAQIIESYKNSLDLYEKGKIAEAENMIFNINKDYTQYPIREDVEDLKKLIYTDEVYFEFDKASGEITDYSEVSGNYNPRFNSITSMRQYH